MIVQLEPAITSLYLDEERSILEAVYIYSVFGILLYKKKERKKKTTASPSPKMNIVNSSQVVSGKGLFPLALQAKSMEGIIIADPS